MAVWAATAPGSQTSLARRDQPNNWVVCVWLLRENPKLALFNALVERKQRGGALRDAAP
jgi:hypothetical protein